MKTLSLACLLLVASVSVSGAQAVRLDSARLLPGARTGTWSATNGSIAFMGTWTAVPDATQSTVTGTWTLMDKAGKTAAFGGWSAAKNSGQWSGAWRANVTGRTGEYSGSWTSSADLKAGDGFGGLFDKAVQAIVSGTWNGAGQSGAWSIRAAKK